MKDPYIFENGTLKNKLGITDYNELNAAEKDIGFIKLINVDKEFAPTFDSALLQNIHKHIFKDIFDWAGEFRTVPIYKEEIVIPGLSLAYCKPEQIPQEVEKCLEEFNQTEWNHLDLDKKANQFSELLAKLWRVHPFRDGNTRTTMAFAYLFGKEHNFPLNLHMMLDSLSRKQDANGKITQYSIRDKFVLAALDKKDYPEPEHLTAVFKKSIISGVSEKIDILSTLLNSPSKTEEER